MNKTAIDEISAEALQEIWNYCEEMQKELLLCDLNENVYAQGCVITCRKIQYKINEKCSDLSKLEKELRDDI